MDERKGGQMWHSCFLKEFGLGCSQCAQDCNTVLDCIQFILQHTHTTHTLLLFIYFLLFKYLFIVFFHYHLSPLYPLPPLPTLLHPTISALLSKSMGPLSFLFDSSTAFNWHFQVDYLQNQPTNGTEQSSQVRTRVN